MTTEATLFRPFWRSRRAAAIAGILFGVLLLTAMAATRIALAEGFPRRAPVGSVATHADPVEPWPGALCGDRLPLVHRRRTRSARSRRGPPVLNGVPRERGCSSWRCCSPVPSPRRACWRCSPTDVNVVLWDFGRDNAQGLISVYAMRMAAVFTLSVSTVGLAASAMPRWVTYLGYLVALVLMVASAGGRGSSWLLPRLGLPGQHRLRQVPPGRRPSLRMTTESVGRDTPDG